MNSAVQVPFIDLRVQHQPIMGELMEAIKQVTEAGAFAGGPFVREFEEAFGRFCGTRHAIGVGSGTEALWLSLLALGIGPGDEVVTAPNGFMGIAEAISLCGARPVFADIDERTYTIDPARVEQAITLRTQAIVPVHIFGQMAEMDSLLAVARHHGTPVVEEASHAHGADYKARLAGSLGATGCFSFYPGNNLGAFGEAGAVVTNDGELHSKIEMLRNHGRAAKYTHTAIGWNSRMDGIQGAVLRLKLGRLQAANAARRAAARLYDEALADEPRVIRPAVGEFNTHVYHIYAVRVPHRDRVLQRMAARGVNCSIHYPVPIHLQKAYAFLGYGPGSFPVAERCAREFLSLPMYPELTPDQIRFVAETLKASLGR